MSQVTKSLLTKKNMTVTVNLPSGDAVSKLTGSIGGFEVKVALSDISVAGDISAFDEAKFGEVPRN